MKIMASESSKACSRSFTYELLTDYDERFDILWQKAIKSYSLIGERTSEFLHWRFTLCPFKKFSTFALIDKETGTVLQVVLEP